MDPNRWMRLILIDPDLGSDRATPDGSDEQSGGDEVGR